MADQIIQGLLPYLIPGLGLVLLTIGYVFWDIRRQNNIFVSNCQSDVKELRSQVSDLTEKILDYQNKLIAIQDSRVEDWQKWFEHNRQLQAKIEEQVERINRLEKEAEERELVVAEQSDLIKRLTESRDLLQAKLDELTERFNTEKENAA